MLSPRDRSLLLELLRPPDGFRMDRVIASTYSLDLIALLSVSLAFTYRSWEDANGNITPDPLAFLNAVRSHAHRISVFCQAGQIAVPPPNYLLLAYTERSIHEASAPSPSGSFHPKVWVLRYVERAAATDAAAEIRYRFLCLSRNLTFDRSWDTALRLDGVLGDRSRAIAGNRPLSEFVAALPDLAVHKLPSATREAIARVADELLRVKFECPEDIDGFSFHPIGHTAASRGLPFPKPIRRLMVMSPFVSPGFFEEVAPSLALEPDEPHVLVTRPEELRKVPASKYARFKTRYQLADDANPELESAPVTTSDTAHPADVESHPTHDPTPSGDGLHAKMFILDDGWNASVWSGSANATHAAFHENVEFLVQLRGKRSKFGINATLDVQTGIGSLLLPLGDFGPEPMPDTEREKWERKLESAARAISTSQLALAVRPSEEPGTHILHLERPSDWRMPPHLQGISVRAWLATGAASAAASLTWDASPLASFPPTSTERLTTLVAFELSVESPISLVHRFALNLPASGMPEDRDQLRLALLIQDRERLLHLLWLMLSGEDSEVRDPAELASLGAPLRGALGTDQGGVLEALLRSLHAAPERLAEVERVIHDLRSTETGNTLVPPDFDRIWKPIHAAWQSLQALRPQQEAAESHT